MILALNARSSLMEHVPQTTSNEAPSANHCGRHRSHTSFREVAVGWKASTKTPFHHWVFPDAPGCPKPPQTTPLHWSSLFTLSKTPLDCSRIPPNDTQLLSCCKATRARTSRGHMRALNAQNTIPHFMHKTFPIRTHNERNYSLKPFGYLFWHSAYG